MKCKILSVDYCLNINISTTNYKKGRSYLTFLILFIETIVVTIIFLGGILGFLDTSISPWLLFFIWILSIILLIIFTLIRKYHKKKYKKEISLNENSPHLKENQFFYQAPMYIFDDIHIKIHGGENMSWTPYFNNTFQKWLSLLNLVTFYGVNVSTPEYSIILKRIHLLSLRPHYKVIINNKEIGQLEKLKITKGGIKQQTPYTFYDKNSRMYKFTNSYFSTKTTLSDKKGNEILSANRSLFDLSRNVITRRRGEKHTLLIKPSTIYPKELWIALYIQTMINKERN